MSKTREVYIVLTNTGTLLSRIIKLYTKGEYSHVSIALDYKLDNMYSFGRLRPYNPFIGGLVHEEVNRGVYKRFKNTKVAIYSINISVKKYKKLKKEINKMWSDREKYSFNIIGLFLVALHIKYKREDSYYCAEFVKYLIDEIKLNVDLPEIVKPMDFKGIRNAKLEYRGLLRNYSV